jgi:hypothetical protein
MTDAVWPMGFDVTATLGCQGLLVRNWLGVLAVRTRRFVRTEEARRTSALSQERPKPDPVGLLGQSSSVCVPEPLPLLADTAW